MEVFTAPLDAAIAMVRDGEITDCKSVAALLWVDRWIAGAERQGP